MLSVSSLCASAYVSVNCTLFAQLPVVDVRQYKGGAAEIFRFALLVDLRSDPSVSEVVQQLGSVALYFYLMIWILKLSCVLEAMLL